MKYNPPNLLFNIILAAFFAISFFSSCVVEKEKIVEKEEFHSLANAMLTMQTYTHKLGLSIEAENLELAHHYEHELEEIMEHVVENIEFYHEHKVSELTKAMLLPAYSKVAEAVDAKDFTLMKSSFKTMIQSCNSCHVATDKAHIKIQEWPTSNPFMQEF